MYIIYVNVVVYMYTMLYHKRVHKYLCSQMEIIAFYFFIITIILNYITLSCVSSTFLFPLIVSYLFIVPLY